MYKYDESLIIFAGRSYISSSSMHDRFYQLGAYTLVSLCGIGSIDSGICAHTHTRSHAHTYIQTYPLIMFAGHSYWLSMGWLRLVGSLKLQVSFAKEPYERDDTLQKRPIILRSLLLVATP